MANTSAAKYGALQNVNDSSDILPVVNSTSVKDDLSEIENQNRKERRNKIIIGCVIIVLLAVSWVGAQQFAQSAVQLASFDAPYFMTWFGTCWMILCFPAYCLFIAVKSRNQEDILNSIHESGNIFDTPHVTMKQFFLKIAPMNVLWMATNYLYLIALKFIAATDASAIFASNVAFVYMLSLCMLKSKLYVIRILACIFCISGVVLFGYVEGFAGGSKLFIGALMAVLTAFGAALYKVIFRVLVGEATFGQVSLFLTFLGISNILFMWTIFMILYCTGVEHFAGYDIPWRPMIASSFLGLVFNYVLSFGVVYTYPLFISIALMLGVPLNAAVDVVIKGVTFNATRLLAAFLVIIGFSIMLLPDRFNYPVHYVLLCKFYRRKQEEKENSVTQPLIEE